MGPEPGSRCSWQLQPARSEKISINGSPVLVRDLDLWKVVGLSLLSWHSKNIHIAAVRKHIICIAKKIVGAEKMRKMPITPITML
jgi:hypothetical protein